MSFDTSREVAVEDALGTLALAKMAFQHFQPDDTYTGYQVRDILDALALDIEDDAIRPAPRLMTTVEPIARTISGEPVL